MFNFMSEKGTHQVTLFNDTKNQEQNKKLCYTHTNTYGTYVLFGGFGIGDLKCLVGREAPGATAAAAARAVRVAGGVHAPPPPPPRAHPPPRRATRPRSPPVLRPARFARPLAHPPPAAMLSAPSLSIKGEGVKKLTNKQ